MSPSDQMAAITSIADQTEEIANRKSDMQCNDLHIQLKKSLQYPAYEFEPSGFQPTRESEIPAEI
jgi:hypothetical protein